MLNGLPYPTVNKSSMSMSMKRFEFACITILSPETVSIVLCQCSIMDSCKCRLFQISLRRLKFRPKRIQNALKTHKEAIINQKNSRGRSPETPLREVVIPPLVPSPTRAFGTRSDFRRTTFKYVATGLMHRDVCIMKQNQI